MSDPLGVPEPDVDRIECTSDARLPRGRIWRLSARGLANSLADALGYTALDPSSLPPDPVSPSGFDTASAVNIVSQDLADRLFTEGMLIAEQALAAVAPCVLAGDASPQCAESFVQATASRLFRRPLLADELSRYAARYQAWAEVHGAATAARMLLRAWVMSPAFVYRTELGSSAAGEIELEPYEIASALSFLTTEAPPDAELLAAAASGTLGDRSVLESHARRLLATPRARQALDGFFRQLLHLGDLENGRVELEPTLAAAMIEETRTFVEQVVWERGGSLGELLGAGYTFVSPELAAHYGAQPDAGGQLTQPGRAGLLSQGGLLTALDDVVHRGLFVRAEMFCTPPDPPPANAQGLAGDVQYPEGATARERYAVFTESIPASCSACHAQFMPLGLSFEHYDALGRYRELDQGKAIDVSGTISGLGDADGSYAGLSELGAKIATSTAGRNCFVKRFMSFSLGREIHGALDGCALLEARDQFVQRGLRVPELIVALTQLDGFTRRLNAP